MVCLEGIDNISNRIWAPTGQAASYAGKADASLSSLMPLVTEGSQRAFIAADLNKTCAAWADAQLPVDVRRHLHRAINESRSGRVTAGLTVLLALCGWVCGGDEGARHAVISGLPPPAQNSRETMRSRLDARRLHPFEAPELFSLVETLCRRAGLRCMPEIYVLPDERAMNAYALGHADDAVVTLTEGLLRGMTKDEVTAILAHEIAHIRNNDGSTMALADSLHRAIKFVSMSGLAMMSARRVAVAGPSLVWLLRSAPAIAELLCLALSRIREFAADALALDLISDSRTLASALEKLERHYRSEHVEQGNDSDEMLSYLRSHPTTDQRVSFVRSLG